MIISNNTDLKQHPPLLLYIHCSPRPAVAVPINTDHISPPQLSCTHSNAGHGLKWSSLAALTKEHSPQQPSIHGNVRHDVECLSSTAPTSHILHSSSTSRTLWDVVWSSLVTTTTCILHRCSISMALWGMECLSPTTPTTHLHPWPCEAWSAYPQQHQPHTYIHGPVRHGVLIPNNTNHTHRSKQHQPHILHSFLHT